MVCITVVYMQTNKKFRIVIFLKMQPSNGKVDLFILRKELKSTSLGIYAIGIILNHLMVRKLSTIKQKKNLRLVDTTRLEFYYLLE